MTPQRTFFSRTCAQPFLTYANSARSPAGNLPMKTLILVSFVFLPVVTSAQTVAPPATTNTTAPPAETSTEDAIKLSPFEVNTSRDTGFAAASSMAGGRLASDLRDTPVAYSVITRDFIDALNLTDLQSAAEWT